MGHRWWYQTYKRNRRNTQVAIEPISSKYHLKQVGKRCERPGLAEGATGVKSGRGRGWERQRERERRTERAHKPFGKFHNRTCRICWDYFNIFDSTWKSVCELVYAWMELGAQRDREGGTEWGKEKEKERKRERER